LTLKLANLERRLDVLEQRAERGAIPSVLIHASPNDAVLRDDVRAALEATGRSVIILPTGRSALRYGDDAPDPQIAASRAYFAEI
jgi:hypothetical protein